MQNLLHVLDGTVSPAITTAEGGIDWETLAQDQALAAAAGHAKQAGAELTLRAEDGGHGALIAGTRLLFWADGRPVDRIVGVASSRLTRDLERWTAWFDALRTLVVRLRTGGHRLLVVPGTATERFVCRAATLWRVPVTTVQLADDSVSLTTWLRSVLTRALEIPHAEGRLECRLQVSPPLRPLEPGCRTFEQPGSPERDRLLIALADWLVVLHVREGGQLLPLVRSALASRGCRTSDIWVCSDEQLVAPSVRNDLQARGAVLWHLADERLDPVIGPCPRLNVPILVGREAAARCRQSPWPYLTHCTGRVPGPWPDQTGDDYLDELLMREPGRDHSALATLRRILEMQRLLGSRRMVRGQVAAVSLTAIPLSKLRHVRDFQAHRGKWRFEPYGLCVTASALATVGARAVIYGDEAAWAGLSPGDRPYFQRAGSGVDPTDTRWTVEQEWRVVGDVDLARISPDDAWVFVPSLQEAQELGKVSRWPIVVWDED